MSFLDDDDLTEPSNPGNIIFKPIFVCPSSRKNSELMKIIENAEDC